MSESVNGRVSEWANGRMGEWVRIGIDYTAAARQRAGIGRYTRELVRALLTLAPPRIPERASADFVFFAAAGGLADQGWQRELERLGREAAARVQVRALPLSDDWMARLWQRLRLPLPVEWVTGPLDVFYSPDFVLPPTRRSTRTLLTVHDLSFYHHPEAFVPALRDYLMRVAPRSIERADVVLADSASTRADVVSLLGVDPDKVRVLYCGVDARFCPEPAPEERERLCARYEIDERPYILSVGTVQPRKNYVRLIQAFSTLNLPAGCQLLIAGGQGWLYEGIEAAAEERDDVRLLGFVDDADLPALYRQAALFASVSLYEGFGLPVLEAMACGTPVVCSNTSSLPEVGGEAALLVDPLDVDGIAEALGRALADNGLHRAMVERGLARAARFTWATAARQLWEILMAAGS